MSARNLDPSYELQLEKGFSLPVYNISQTVPRMPCHDDEPAIRDEVLSTPEFIRYARISGVLRGGLKQIIELADDFFVQIAEKVNATVVQHSWGLAPIPQRPDALLLRHPVLPKGLTLVAKVVTLAETRQPDGPALQGIEAIDYRDHEVTGPHGTYTWYDGGPSQFVMSQNRLYLVDIEPMMLPTEM